MEHLLDAIRSATANDATQEARQAGIAACRALLGSLQVVPGGALTAIGAGRPSLLAALGQLGPDQVLELVVTKLRGLLPPGAAPPAPPARFQVPMIVPPARMRGAR